MTPLQSLIACGTKLWLDSIDPDLVRENHALGATGATSNPIIVSDLLKTGRFDEKIRELACSGLSDTDIAWQMTDYLVHEAERIFQDVYHATQGDDGYVSFELDPLLEDKDCPFSHAEKVARYVDEGRRWSAGHSNRLIKVPATPAGLDALEEMVAAGVNVNVTLLFTRRQYVAARDAVWRGAQRRKSLGHFKSVYSIFISRIDVYTKQHVQELSSAAQGQVGIINAKRLWRENTTFWADKHLPLKQEFVFASTGVKDPSEPADKYVEALAGSDIQTNPPATNAAVQKMIGKVYTRQIDHLPPQEVITEIDSKVDFVKLEQVLMEEGLAKFADPFKQLLKIIAQKRPE